MTQEEIIRMAREAGFEEGWVEVCNVREELTNLYNLGRAHAKSDQINTAYQQGCEDMKRRMEKRIQQLESQLQLCKTAVAAEREACAKVCEARYNSPDFNDEAIECADAIRARGEK